MNNFIIEKAGRQHLKEARNLLKESDLPFEDIEKHFENFFIAKNDDIIIGLIGMEKYSDIALLRSFAVKKDYRNSGTGKMLFETLKQFAQNTGISDFYLLTTTAEKYFEKEGFARVNRENLPVEIQNTEEFNSLCPVSAICMSYHLD